MFLNKNYHKISTRIARHHIQRYSASDASTQSNFCTSTGHVFFSVGFKTDFLSIKRGMTVQICNTASKVHCKNHMTTLLSENTACLNV